VRRRIVTLGSGCTRPDRRAVGRAMGRSSGPLGNPANALLVGSDPRGPIVVLPDGIATVPAVDPSIGSPLRALGDRRAANRSFGAR
jgi:hypothetical protein